MKPYLDLLRRKGAPRTALGGFLARFYSCTMCLGPITMLTTVGHSYFVAATVSSCTAFCTFFIAPKVSALMDRLGQGRVIPLASFIALIGLAGLLVNTALGGPYGVDYPFAILMGAAPNVQAITRARWTYLLGQSDGDGDKTDGAAGEHGAGASPSDRKTGTVEAGYGLMRTAFSFEGVLDDVAFMIGPAVVIALSTLWFPESGPLFSGLTFTIGIIVIMSCKSTEPVPLSNEELAGKTSAAKGSMLRSSAIVRVLFACMFMMGVFYGALDPTVLALCRQFSSVSTASIIFSLSSAISIVSGLVFGSIVISATLKHQLYATGIAIGVAYGAMAFVGSLPSLIAISSVACIAYAPFLITVNSVCVRCVPEERVTESLTWVSTGMTFGLAFGPLGSGWLISSVSTHASLILCAACALAIPVVLFASTKVVNRVLGKPRAK